MRFSHVVVFFLTVFLLFFSVAMLQNVTVTEYEKENRQMAVELSNACMDAFDSIDINAEYLFDTTQKREKVLDEFYESMRVSEGKILLSESERLRTPFVVLVDYDGFYVSYNAVFDNDSTGCADKLTAITPKNSFTASVRGFTVSYALNNTLKVIKPSGEVIRGSYDELRPLGIFTDRSEYEKKKNDCIVSCIEREVNYLVNNQGISTARGTMGYDITFVKEKGANFERLLDRPTIIAFMQGDTGRTAKSTLDCFAYARSEMTEGELYYASGGYYHKANANSYSVVNQTTHLVSDQSNTHVGKLGTMRELAIEGNHAGSDLKH